MGRRFSVARRLARLFASYAGQRPSLVADWSAGRDTDGAGRALAADLAWQPELWRRLVDRVDGSSPLARHAATVARLREDPEAFDLPVRLSLFGHTRLSAHRDRAARRARGRARRPRLAAPPVADPVADPDRTGGDGRPGRRRQPPAGASSPAGRASGVTRASSSGPWPRRPSRPTRSCRPRPCPTRCSAGSRATSPPTCPGPTAACWPSGTGRSRCTRATASPARSTCCARCCSGLLDDDPTLEPRDVLVMCPDIETYAPLIEAGFGLGDVVGSSRPSRPPAAGPARRPRAGADQPAARRRHGAARSRRRAGAGDAGPRPGTGRAGAAAVRVQRRRPRPARHLGARVRACGGPSTPTTAPSSGSRATSPTPGSSGSTGCSTGVALSDDSSAWLDRALPLDDVGSAQVDLVGRLTEYVDRLRDATDRLTGTRPLDHWLGAARRRRLLADRRRDR